MSDPLCDMLTEVKEYTTKLMKLAFENTVQSKSSLQFLNTTWRNTFPDEFCDVLSKLLCQVHNKRHKELFPIKSIQSMFCKLVPSRLVCTLF